MATLLTGMKSALQDFNRVFNDWELRGLTIFGIIILAVGSVFYMQVEGWDFWQALYFCVTSLTTVGYGDLHPTTDFSRIFTTFYILVGVGFILGFVNVAARQAVKPLVDRMASHLNDTKK